MIMNNNGHWTNTFELLLSNYPILFYAFNIIFIFTVSKTNNNAEQHNTHQMNHKK